MNKKNTINKYYIYIIVAAFVYAFYNILNKMFLVDISPLAFAWGTSVVSAGLSIIYLMFSKKTKQIKKMNKLDWTYVAILGVVVMSFGKLLYFHGLSLITATSTSFLLRVSPISAIIFSWFLIREKITKKQTLIMFYMIAGVFILTTQGQFTLELGSIFIVMAGIVIGVDHTLTRKIIKRGIHPNIMSSLVMILVAISLTVLVLIFEEFTLVHWKIFLLCGSLIFIPKLIRNMALGHIKSPVVGTVLLVHPLFVAVLGALVLGESLTLIQASGAFVILSGAYFLIKQKE
jgi:drug/metabolite transporter (DMT)-like permease